ncbi:MAG: hypothetical protein J5I90_19620 [Caldilineales bacterium]|nr:hypothetical protein [Caldilineales bacterium]
MSISITAPINARHLSAASPKYRAFNLRNFRKIPQIERLSASDAFAVEVVGNVLPFRANNYVIDELIDWDKAPDDPMFRLTFPQRNMLRPRHFDRIANLLLDDADQKMLQTAATEIRWQLNPHPAGQLDKNVPRLDGKRVQGIQHKYRETVLFFPSQGQTCHAFCSFCFRWPQFVGMEDIKFVAKEADALIRYLRQHPEVTDVLFTGGDPLVMTAKNLAAYIDPLLEANLPNLRTIRIGSKSLSYWPYRFLTDRDADDLLRLFERIVKSGLHLAIMAHFNHTAELKTAALEQAVRRIRNTGAVIRTQSPLLRHINDDANMWAEMWRKQVSLGMIPYYMFVVRDTGAQHYFGLPLVEAWHIFQQAYQQVSGICRTVRGPSMSASPGKVQVLGVPTVGQDRTIALRFLQARNPNWVQRPFFARYDAKAIWLDELRPAFGKSRFFYEERPVEFNRQSLQVTGGIDENLGYVIRT